MVWAVRVPSWGVGGPPRSLRGAISALPADASEECRGRAFRPQDGQHVLWSVLVGRSGALDPAGVGEGPNPRELGSLRG